MRILSSGVFNAPLRHGGPILRGHNSPEDLSEQTIQTLNQITHDVSYPEAALIFGEGQDSRGVYVVCEGRVKLTNANCDGKTFIMKIAQPGEILGLHDVVTGSPYTLTAEALQPSQLGFISGSDFLAFIKHHSDMCIYVTQQLISDCNSAYEVIRSIGLSGTVAEKLARLFLHWSIDGQGIGGVTQLKQLLTHEEIAQLIGSTRETVTRVLGRLRKSKVVELDGFTLAIWDKVAIERLAQSDNRATMR